MVDSYQYILHILGQDIDKQVILPIGVTTIGRDAGNTLILPNPLISRHHARIDCTLSDCTITDLNSANGTVVNDQKIPAQVQIALSDNALIKIGPMDIHLKAIKQEEKEIPVPMTTAAPEEKVPAANERASSDKQPEGAPSSAIVTGSLDQSLVDEIPPNEPPPPPPSVLTPQPEKETPIPPPGLEMYSIKLLEYLPGIYHEDFTSRFLALFESILFPIEWNVDNFDLFLDPGTTPGEFIPWLLNWFKISLDPTWDEPQRRKLLKEANEIFCLRGTLSSLTRVLQIYLGNTPVIVDDNATLPPYTFKVKISMQADQVNQKLIEQLININKPAYTTYTIEYSG